MKSIEEVDELEKIDVLILVEHKDRELQSAVLLKEKLIQKEGYSVKIASLIFDLWKVVWRYKPRFVILPYCRWEKTDTVALYKYLYGREVVFINLNYEQICNPNLGDEKKPRDSFARDELIYSCWGENSKQFFYNCGVPNEHLLITGKMENYILNKMAHSNSRELKNHIVSENENLCQNDLLIFIPMDDNWVFLDDLTEKFYKKGTWARDKVIEYKNYLSDTVFMLLEWTCKLDPEEMLKKHIKIIIRPHPGVGTDYYQRYYMEKIGIIPQFVYITKQYTAKEWIIICDKCISNYSTLLLDSSYIGVKSGLVRKDEIPENVKMDWFDDIMKLNSFTSFKDFIFSNNETNKSQGSLRKYIDTAKDPVNEICKFIKLNFHHESLGASVNKTTGLIMYRLRYFMPSFLRTIAYKIKSDSLSLDKLKYDYLTEDEVEFTKNHLKKWFDI